MNVYAKVVASLIICAVIIAVLFGGVQIFTNKQIFDLTQSFERAIVSLDGIKIAEGRVSSWKDFEDGDSIQVKIGGKTYLTHISNVVLVSE